MERNKVRIPVQKRSIEKKRRIIEAARTTFAEYGYASVTVPQIAKRAGLSTGTVYAYFHDKRDILFVCMQQFREEILANFAEKLNHLETTDDLRQTVRDVLGILVDAHAQSSRRYHDDLMALRYSDPQIGAFLNSTFTVLTDAMITRIGEHGYAFRHPKEQSLLAGLLVSEVQSELSWTQVPKVQYDRETIIADTADMIIAMLDRTDSRNE